MKELSVEEKAKRYDEAIERAKDLYDFYSGNPAQAQKIIDIFPELKESEDEKIKKHLITLFKGEYGENSSARFAGIKVKDIISWLEKQGEHANFRKNIQVGDKVTRNEDGMLVNLSQLARIAKKDEKQGEQKSSWSEEDEACKNTILCAVQGKFITQAALEQAIEWFKDLKDRYAWKPSKEQIYILNWVANIFLSQDSLVEQNVSNKLQTLYNDLKKLM